MMEKGKILFKLGFDKNTNYHNVSMSSSFTDSPSNKEYPSLKFEFEIHIVERKKQEEQSEKFNDTFKKI